MKQLQIHPGYLVSVILFAVICVIMVGANLDRKKSGHIVAIVPETEKHKATGSTGIGDKRTVTVPLQSQAGRTNWKYRAFDWRKNHEPLMMYYWEK